MSCLSHGGVSHFVTFYLFISTRRWGGGFKSFDLAVTVLQVKYCADWIRLVQLPAFFLGFSTIYWSFYQKWHWISQFQLGSGIQWFWHSISLEDRHFVGAVVPVIHTELKPPLVGINPEYLTIWTCSPCMSYRIIEFSTYLKYPCHTWTIDRKWQLLKQQVRLRPHSQELCGQSNF